MIVPDCFNTSLTEAEQAAFQILLDATGSQANRQGFLGYDPNIANTWLFEVTKVSIPEIMFYQNVDRIVFKAYAECNYQIRANCQAWFMSILAKLPIKNHENSNIVIFRIASDSQISESFINLKNEKSAVRIFSKSIEFDLEFLTGGKGSAI